MGGGTHSPFLTMTERFDPPPTFDLRVLAEGPLSMETTVTISDADGQVDEGPYTLTIALAGIEDVEVAAGQFTGTAHLHLTAQEPGGYVAETDVWIDAEQALVRRPGAHLGLAGAGLALERVDPHASGGRQTGRPPLSLGLVGERGRVSTSRW